MANKKLIEKMIEEFEKQLEGFKDSYERAEIMDRFTHRKALTLRTGKGDDMLMNSKRALDQLKMQIDATEEGIVFLREIKDEK